MLSVQARICVTLGRHDAETSPPQKISTSRCGRGHAAVCDARCTSTSLSIAASADRGRISTGGAWDITARLIGQWLSERLGQQFIVENRAGAGGSVGTEAVVHALPDGYTLLLFGTTDFVNTSFYDNLRFNFIRDIAPVAGLLRMPHVMEVNPSFPAKTVPEFIAYARANPGKINMGSAGAGTPDPCYRRTLQDDGRH